MAYGNDFLIDLFTSTLKSNNTTMQHTLLKPLSPPELVAKNLPLVQAYGSIHSTYPYYYEISGLETYCLIYTESGTGTLFYNNKNHSLISNTLAIINCKNNHKIKINQSPWNYKVFYISGTNLSFLYNALTDHDQNLYTFSSGSDIPSLILKFYKQLDKNPEKYYLHAKLIGDILYDLLLEKNRLEECNTNTPDYLIEIKRKFDENYDGSYSLDALENHYHISKYRLCREFTNHAGISPIQYLNQRRIEAAKDALRNSDKRINEIGRMIGIENTNHFIQLFKRQTGVTPLIYRKQPPAGIHNILI